MKPQKRKRSSKYRDRLSEMPDEVIVHILSYLTIFDAVGTMLIRRFGNLWTLVPNLRFDSQEIVDMMAPDVCWESKHVERFYIFVRNVLMLHKRPSIDKFHLLGWQDEDRTTEIGDDIRMWLRFALDKQAKEIFFSDVHFKLANSSDFPNFTSQSLVELELHFCSIHPQLQVNLGSLKKLILYYTKMCEEVFLQFICGCPSLQEMRITGLYSIKKLRFSAPNIRKFSLVLPEDEYSDDPWSLDFPNLKSLDLEIGRIPDVINVSSVRDVCLRSVYFDKDDENEIRRFNIFLEKFSHCEVFELSLDAQSTFPSIDDLHLLQIRWKHVVLRLRVFCQSCLLGVYQLMRSSKDLEELDIYTNATSASRESVDLPPVGLSNPFVMPKLKIVTLHGYAVDEPWKHQLHLIEFFLKSATVLEKLVIVLEECRSTAREQLDFVMHVSSFQRSSPSARVLFL